jgi:hypothetical protein
MRNILEKGGENKMNDFLPKGYKTPEIQSNFMELEEGKNAFRIFSVDAGEGNRKPIRVRTAEEIPTSVKNATDNQSKAKQFWAFTVFNYKTNSIQVLELKQQTILRAIEALVNNAK